MIIICGFSEAMKKGRKMNNNENDDDDDIFFALIKK